MDKNGTHGREKKAVCEKQPWQIYSIKFISFATKEMIFFRVLPVKLTPWMTQVNGKYDFPPGIGGFRAGRDGLRQQ